MSALPPIIIVPNPSMTPTDYSTIYNNALSLGYSPQQAAPIVSAAMLNQGFTQAQIGDAISMPGSVSSSQTLSTEPGAASATGQNFSNGLGGLWQYLTEPTYRAQLNAAYNNSPKLQAAVKQGTGSTGTSWLAAHAGNYGLVAFGAILALGALLISQKGTIVKVTSTAAKASALLG